MTSGNGADPAGVAPGLSWAAAAFPDVFTASAGR
ncbi:MAG: hypothetical protein JWQ95_2943 [Sphaerisporangium sp.]|jgi:hypothetical protein|nr:hypothetical protein [Sphaerisporangium sp.]